MDLLSLKDIAGGALQEKTNTAMQKVIENMQDPNTPWKNQRQINIKIAFVQNEDRDDMAVAVSVDTKLAPVTPVLTRMAVGKDIRSGKVYAQEYGRQIKGQMSLDLGQQAPGAVVEVDGDLVDKETGEVVEDKVIDLRRAAL
ncbi:hypothetical protein AALB47_11525 [Lachnospiraceae bacterium 54-11]